MKRISAAITVLALAALPAFGADLTAREAAAKGAGNGAMPDRREAVPEGEGQAIRNQMLGDPEHLLMMGYHRNVANFGHILCQAADRGATVPARLARVSVAEMRRSVEEMEKCRAMALRERQGHPERQKMMDEHLVQLKTNLRELETLAKSDKIDSEQVKKHLQQIFQECRGAGCDTMPGSARHGMPGHRGPGGWQYQQLMPEHGMMMQRMLQKVKSQDAELAGMVQEMTKAPKERKLDLVVETVTRMVQQRADMTAEMERMQQEMLPGKGEPMQPDMMMHDMMMHDMMMPEMDEDEQCGDDEPFCDDEETEED